jgi:hypothetical protein
MIYYKVSIFDTTRREFIAKIIADLGKAIFTIGLASYFFERFSSTLKIILWLACIILFTVSIFIHPTKK